MSLDIQHINGDSTFLLTFTSAPSCSARPNNDGSFTVLVDPWLEGDAAIFHPKFALAKRTIPSCVQHLSELPTPNVVVISQDRTDHCHEGTLKQLDPKLAHTVILAHPTAARKIRRWKYFNNDRVHAFQPFSDGKNSTIIRFMIPSIYPDAMPGEATLAFINAKYDMTGLHNAIGITYRPPAPPPLMMSPLSSPTSPCLQHPVSTYDLRSPCQSMPPTPPRSPPQSDDDFVDSPAIPQSRSSPESSWSLPINTHGMEPPSRPPPPIPRQHRHTRSDSSQNFSRLLRQDTHTSASTGTTGFTSECEALRERRSQTSERICPTSPAWTSPSTLSYTALRPKTLSVIYSPHGCSYDFLRPYATSHLIHNAALPLTCLLHSFDKVQNTWYLGGNINSGSPGGLEIARNLLARCWISAHDEDKENSGIAVLKVVTRKYTADEVAALLEEGMDGSRDKRGSHNKVTTDVRVLGVGEHKVLP